jgi:hypothetical protein
MAISSEELPSELHYIIPLAERHGSNARIALFDHHLGRHVQYGEKLSSDDIESLRQLYYEIKAKGHGPLINSWHATCKATHDRDIRDTTWPVYGLLCLFAQLGSLGVSPFNDGSVGPEED